MWRLRARTPGAPVRLVLGPAALVCHLHRRGISPRSQTRESVPPPGSQGGVRLQLGFGSISIRQRKRYHARHSMRGPSRHRCSSLRKRPAVRRQQRQPQFMSRLFYKVCDTHYDSMYTTARATHTRAQVWRTLLGVPAGQTGTAAANIPPSAALNAPPPPMDTCQATRRTPVVTQRIPQSKSIKIQMRYNTTINSNVK